MKLIKKIKKESRSSLVAAWSIAVLLLVVSACETDDPNEDPAANRDQFIGVWQVTENTGINHPQFYQVNIVAGTADDQIFIEGLYNESNSRIEATISGLNLSIPSQISDNISYIGSGMANTDYSQIDLNFTADDGSGPDNVEAVLVP